MRDSRHLSYASAAQTWGGRRVIRLLENATGRRGLIRQGSRPMEGANFFDGMARRYGLRLEVVAGHLELIPKTGPLIVVANHPYGILDGLVLGQILSQRRDDFRILANDVFCRGADLDRFLLPLCFDDTSAAQRSNIDTRKAALELLRQGGAIGIFPGGTVSTATTPFGQPLDPAWRLFPARMIARSQATVLPLYFHGQTSRMFQVASHLHETLRLGLLLHEFRRRVNRPVYVSVGVPILPTVLTHFAGDNKAMMDFLRKATYEMSLKPSFAETLGYDFEK